MLTTDWVESGSADNGVATATHAAVSGRAHYITCVIASYSAAQEGLLTLTAGSGTLFEVEVATELDIEFPHPIQLGENVEVSVSLDASGSPGTLGYVALMGFTI